MTDPNKGTQPSSQGEDQGQQSIVDALLQSFNAQLDALKREKAQSPLQGEEVKLGMDETIIGGKYLRNGQLINANGEPIDENGKKLKKD